MVRLTLYIRIASRAPSSLSIRKDSPIPRADGSIPGTPRAMPPPLSRTPSANTVTQSRHFLPPSPRQRNTRPATTIQSSGLGRRFETNPSTTPLSTAAETTRTSSPASSSSSSSSSSSDGEVISRSHAFRRPPRFRAQKPSLADIDNDDSEDEDSPTFLPFAQPGTAAPSATAGPQARYADPSATLRDAQLRGLAARADETPDPSAQRHHRGGAAGGSSDKTVETQQDGARTPDRKHKGKGKQPAMREAESSPTSSSASSAAFVGVNAATSAGGQASGHPHSAASAAAKTGQQQAQPSGKHRRLDTLSPRHRAELARLSPRRQGSKGSVGSGGHTHENSDGTPSMGSSFSDLDGMFLLAFSLQICGSTKQFLTNNPFLDTSITQSALEEALASNLRHGGASRLSNLSHAFRSRYMQ